MTKPLNADRPSGRPAVQSLRAAGRRRHPPAPGSPPTSRTARRLLSNPGFRRHWKIDQFPPEIRQLIFDGYATGKSYRQIQEEVLARGYSISNLTLCQYWRYRWMLPRTEAQTLLPHNPGAKLP